MKELNKEQQVIYDGLIKILNLMPYPDKAIEQVDRLVESLLVERLKNDIFVCIDYTLKHFRHLLKDCNNHVRLEWLYNYFDDSIIHLDHCFNLFCLSDIEKKNYYRKFKRLEQAILKKMYIVTCKEE